MDRISRHLILFQRRYHNIESEIRHLISKNKNGYLGDLRFTQPARGKTTLTFFVEIDGKNEYFLRCLPGRAEMLRLSKTADFCLNHEIPAPRLVGTADGIWSRFLCGFYLALEELVVGDHIEDFLNTPKRQATIHLLAKQLASLHQHKRDNHGPVSNVSLKPYFAWYLKNAEKKLSAIRKTPGWVTEDEIATIRRFLSRGIQAGEAVRSYSLIHGALGGWNVLMDASSRVVFIDLTHMHFGLTQYDLQSVYHYLLKDDRNAYETFLDSYHTVSGERENSGISSLSDLFRVIVLLKSLPLRGIEIRREDWLRQWYEIVAVSRGKTS